VRIEIRRGVFLDLPPGQYRTPEELYDFLTSSHIPNDLFPNGRPRPQPAPPEAEDVERLPENTNIADEDVEPPHKYKNIAAYDIGCPPIVKNMAVGVGVILFLVLVMAWMQWSQTNWHSVINFESDLDTTQFRLLVAPGFNKQFGVAHSWLREQSQKAELSSEFFETVTKKADELWAARLKADCRERASVSACGELRRKYAM
jgi:hypothetical protein